MLKFFKGIKGEYYPNKYAEVTIFIKKITSFQDCGDHINIYTGDGGWSITFFKITPEILTQRGHDISNSRNEEIGKSFEIWNGPERRDAQYTINEIWKHIEDSKFRDVISLHEFQCVEIEGF